MRPPRSSSISFTHRRREPGASSPRSASSARPLFETAPNNLSSTISTIDCPHFGQRGSWRLARCLLEECRVHDARQDLRVAPHARLSDGILPSELLRARALYVGSDMSGSAPRDTSLWRSSSEASHSPGDRPHRDRRTSADTRAADGRAPAGLDGMHVDVVDVTVTIPERLAAHHPRPRARAIAGFRPWCLGPGAARHRRAATCTPRPELLRAPRVLRRSDMPSSGRHYGTVSVETLVEVRERLVHRFECGVFPVGPPAGGRSRLRTEAPARFTSCFCECSRSPSRAACRAPLLAAGRFVRLAAISR